MVMAAPAATLPPGTILQMMYLRERLVKLPAGMFIEVGPGAGEITALLLSLGWTGHVYDLEPETTNRLNARFASEIAAGKLQVLHENFLAADHQHQADLIISCMVMEHLEDADQDRYMQAARASLKPKGLLIGLVPASEKDWGIEDDIAGHMRRYTRASLHALAEANHWRISHMAGLTFPVSNILLPISNVLVRRAEAEKLKLSALERTKQSGKRHVRFKTHFPALLKLFLNETVMLPLHWLQKACAGASRALVLYFEAEAI